LEVDEAYRILGVDGLLCISGIGRGNIPISKVFTEIWDKIFEWIIQYSNKLISLGIATDVLILRKGSPSP